VETLALPLPASTPGKLVALTRYVTLGIDPDRRTSILAGVDYCEAAAELTGVERQKNDVMPYTMWKVFPWGDEHTFDLIETWLRTWEFGGPQVRKIIRELCSQMMKLIDKELREAGRKPFKTTAQVAFEKAKAQKTGDTHALTRQAYRRRQNRR
jgi:hypothetical protein